MIDLNWLGAQFPDLEDLEPLGRGGQKEVFAGTHREDGAVVLKVFHVHAERERALREVRASLDLAGAKIPRTHDLGTAHAPTGEMIWVREQRVPGRNLRTILDQSPLDDKEVIQLATDLLAVLAAAEELEIVHRDVKPDNIIAAQDGTYWLIDFGLARYLNLSTLTASGLGHGVGTPGYAPPEQFRNLKPEIDSRADLFSLGVTIYESVEGYNPLRRGARDHLEMLRRTESTPLPLLSRDIAGARGFTDLVGTMTRIRKRHRPKSVSYAQAWLDDIVSS